MKKLLFILLFMGIQLPLLYAQNENTPPQGDPGRHQSKDRVSLLKEQLNLSDEQAKKIETIFNDRQKQREALMKKQHEEMENFRNEMEAMAESSEKEILTVLSDEQKTEYKSFREERNNGRMMPPPMGPMGCPFDGRGHQNPPMEPMGCPFDGMGPQNPPMMPMGPQNPHMMQMQPMEQFGLPEIGHEGFISGRMMPPPPQNEMRDNRSVQQDKPAVYKAKKGGNKTPAVVKEKAE